MFPDFFERRIVVEDPETGEWVWKDLDTGKLTIRSPRTKQEAEPEQAWWESWWEKVTNWLFEPVDELETEAERSGTRNTEKPEVREGQRLDLTKRRLLRGFPTERRVLVNSLNRRV